MLIWFLEFVLLPGSFFVASFVVIILFFLGIYLTFCSVIVVQNLSQLASINYDLLSKGFKDDPSSNRSA